MRTKRTLINMAYTLGTSLLLLLLGEWCLRCCWGVQTTIVCFCILYDSLFI